MRLSIRLVWVQILAGDCRHKSINPSFFFTRPWFKSF